MNVCWHCLNRDCGEVVPAETDAFEPETRTCICGSPMQKRMQPAVFSYLNFLREEEYVEPGHGSGKERTP